MPIASMSGMKCPPAGMGKFWMLIKGFLRLKNIQP
jgi:hypothetical protein